MTPEIVTIYFSDPRHKIKSNFGRCGNGFPKNLLLGVFLTTVLIGLGMDE